MFVFFSRLLLESKTKLMFVINLIILLNITYRGLVTFSRGGMLTGFIMIIILLAYLFMKTKSYGRYNLSRILIFMSIAFFMTWGYTSNQTGGLIDKRYANKDASGRVKESKLSGREDIWNSEIDDFLDRNDDLEDLDTELDLDIDNETDNETDNYDDQESSQS